MLDSFKLLISKSWLAKITILFFVVISGWWLTIYWRGLTEGNENNLFTLLYFWISLVGSLWGFYIAKQWGGLKSILGKTLFFLALGLLAQFIGQVTYSYYIYVLGVDVPYPSIGDIGYFGSVVSYIIAVIYLLKVVGAKTSFRSYKGMSLAVILPLLLLLASYAVFLRQYEFDWNSPLRVLLDFGYPLGQAFYVSLAILSYLFSRKFLGGLMRGPILFLIVALVIQYFSDYMFLYQFNQDQWYVGGGNDYLYFLSYVVMTIALGNMGLILKQIRSS